VFPSSKFIPSILSFLFLSSLLSDILFCPLLWSPVSPSYVHFVSILTPLQINIFPFILSSLCIWSKEQLKIFFQMLLFSLLDTESSIRIKSNHS
jgi:hypothetical protein